MLASTLLRGRMNPAAWTFAVEEIYLYRPQVIANRLVGVVAVDLIVAENRYRNPPDARVAHSLEQMSIMLAKAPPK